MITDLNEFRRLLRALLISSEYKLTEKEADRLLNEKPMIVVNGFMTGNLNATAVALMIEGAANGSCRGMGFQNAGTCSPARSLSDGPGAILAIIPD